MERQIEERTPAIADIDGDGKLDIVVGNNEEYVEDPNATIDPAYAAAGLLLGPGNARVYALWNDGANHEATSAQAATPHTQDQAYKSGWPAKLAMLLTELLPTVGTGVNTQPAIFTDAASGDTRIAVASAAGSGYVLAADGSSALGEGPDGKAVTLANAVKGPLSTALDLPSLIAVGGFSVVNQTGLTMTDLTIRRFGTQGWRPLGSAPSPGGRSGPSPRGGPRGDRDPRRT